MTTKPRKKLNFTVRPEDLDWSKSTRELAAKHDVSLGYVWLHRRRLAPHTIPKPNAAKIDWASVDWQQSNYQLKKSLSCSHPVIRKMRMTHAPGTPDPELKRERAVQRRLNSKWAKIDWSLTTDQLIRLTGESRQVISYHRNFHATRPVARRGKFPPDVDWTLSNEEIATRHHVALKTVYNHRLKQLRTQRQK